MAAVMGVGGMCEGAASKEGPSNDGSDGDKDAEILSGPFHR